jgi:hypothetical protein
MSVLSVGMGTVVGAPMALYFARGLHMSPERGKSMPKRARCSRAYITGVGRGRDYSRRGVGIGRFDDVMGLGRGRRRP